MNDWLYTEINENESLVKDSSLPFVPQEIRLEPVEEEVLESKSVCFSLLIYCSPVFPQ